MLDESKIAGWLHKNRNLDPDDIFRGFIRQEYRWRFGSIMFERGHIQERDLIGALSALTHQRAVLSKPVNKKWAGYFLSRCCFDRGLFPTNLTKSAGGQFYFLSLDPAGKNTREGAVHLIQDMLEFFKSSVEKDFPDINFGTITPDKIKITMTPQHHLFEGIYQHCVDPDTGEENFYPPWNK